MITQWNLFIPKKTVISLQVHDKQYILKLSFKVFEVSVSKTETTH